MPKVTSKLQLTVPKAIADQYGIRAGDELEWIPAGEAIRVIRLGRGRKASQGLTLQERLKLFDAATERQRRREMALKKSGIQFTASKDRGWRREDLYQRGLSD